MPHANIWIRQDDWEKWQKLPNKSEAVSRMLNVQYTEVGDKLYVSNGVDPLTRYEGKTQYSGPPPKTEYVIKHAGKVKGTTPSIPQPTPVIPEVKESVCPHGNKIGQCHSRLCNSMMKG